MEKFAGEQDLARPVLPAYTAQTFISTMRDVRRKRLTMFKPFETKHKIYCWKNVTKKMKRIVYVYSMHGGPEHSRRGKNH